jgi:hypothetical protein
MAVPEICFLLSLPALSNGCGSESKSDGGDGFVQAACIQTISANSRTWQECAQSDRTGAPGNYTILTEENCADRIDLAGRESTEYVEGGVCADLGFTESCGRVASRYWVTPEYVSTYPGGPAEFCPETDPGGTGGSSGGGGDACSRCLDACCSGCSCDHCNAPCGA